MKVKKKIINGKNVFLGLGSNIDNKIDFLKKAIQIISANKDINIEKISSFYKTPPVGFKEQDYFINAVIKICTSLSPFDLLKFLQDIEKRLGRKRIIKWGPRTIDIDILFYSNWIIDKNSLKIPHPLLHERAFVLIPLNEIEHSFIHPVLNETISNLLNQLNLNDIRDIEMVVESKSLECL